MKRFLLWSFERGSKQYDVICALILAFIFLTPAYLFDDRPDFMRISQDQSVRRSQDDDGHVVFTVKVDDSASEPLDILEREAVDRLHEVLQTKFEVSRAEPIYNTTGKLASYAIWIDSRGAPLK